MYFCVNGFEVGVNDSIFSVNEQQKVYIVMHYLRNTTCFSVFTLKKKRT